MNSMKRKIETILIGTSLTEASDAVVRGGMKLARSAGARAHLVHAYTPPTMYSGSPFLPEVPLGEVLKAERVALQRKLDSQIERLGIERSELAGIHLDMGPAPRLLVDTARAIGASLLVVGAAESPRLARVFGSTADRVVRKAGCPVLVVRGDLDVPPRRVLLPVDLSPLSADAAELGLALLAQVAGPQAGVERTPELESMFVVAEPERPVSRLGPAEPPAPANPAAAEELRRFTAASCAAAGVADWPVRPRVESGFVDTAILERIEQWGPDLVVLGTHGRGGFERFLLGSVAATVVRDGWTSVLVIPPKAAREAFTAPVGTHAAA
jgi:nucleotide-binding universal stress UspA family protein